MAEAERRTVRIGVTTLEQAKERTAAAFQGEKQGSAIMFLSPELLWRTLTEKRWAILKVMTGQGAMSIREAARRVGRDVKAVHADIHALLSTGVLRKTEDGLVEFPYDEVHVDFVITPAANAA